MTTSKKLMQASAGYLASQQQAATTDVTDLFEVRTYTAHDVTYNYNDLTKYRGGFVPLSIHMAYEGDTPDTTYVYSNLYYIWQIHRNDVTGKYAFHANDGTGNKVIGLLDTDMSVQWAVKFDLTPADFTIDGSDNIYVLEPTQTNTGVNYSNMVYKFDSTGTCVRRSDIISPWSYYDGSGTYDLTKITAHSNGELFVAGNVNPDQQSTSTVQLLIVNLAPNGSMYAAEWAGYYNNAVHNYINDIHTVYDNSRSSEYAGTATGQHTIYSAADASNSSRKYLEDVFYSASGGFNRLVSGNISFKASGGFTNSRSIGTGGNFNIFTIMHNLTVETGSTATVAAQYRYDSTSSAGYQTYWGVGLVFDGQDTTNNVGYGLIKAFECAFQSGYDGNETVYSLNTSLNHLVFTKASNYPLFGLAQCSGRENPFILFRHAYRNSTSESADWQMTVTSTVPNTTIGVYDMDITNDNNIIICGQASGEAYITKVSADGSGEGICGPVTLTRSRDLYINDTNTPRSVEFGSSSAGVNNNLPALPTVSTNESNPDVSNVASTHETTAEPLSGSGSDELTGGMAIVTNRDGAAQRYLVDSVTRNKKSGGWDTMLNGQTMTDASTLTSISDTNGGINELAPYGLNFGGTRVETLDNDLQGADTDHIVWAWKRKRKFFDIVVYDGDNNYLATSDNTPQTIQHNLGSVPGMIWIKNITTGANWKVWHRSAGNTAELDTNVAFNSANNGDGSIFTVTDTSFNVGPGVSGELTVNRLGNQYVAYIFAHNDGDGEFGPNRDQDIIKCGGYDGNSPNSVKVTLGFEPQWVMVKLRTNTGGWSVFDSQRGMNFTEDDPRIFLDTTTTEGPNDAISLDPDGFTIHGTASEINQSGNGFVYMAIRKGPLNQPTAGTEVFAIDSMDANGEYQAPFNIDMILRRDVGQPSNWISAYRGNEKVRVNISNSVDLTNDDSYVFDLHNTFGNNDGDFNTGLDVASSTNLAWMFKRAPGFFDIVNYTGDGSSNRNILHNLGVKPAMMWIANHTGNSSDFRMYLSDEIGTGEGFGKDYVYIWHDYGINPDITDVPTSNFFTANPTSSQFSIGLGPSGGLTAPRNPNESGVPYVAYLFGEIPGVSKFGTYVADGESQVIDCGFTTGARWVLIRRHQNSNGDLTSSQWTLFDTRRGITDGNGTPGTEDDPTVYINKTDVQNTSTNKLGPDSSGFRVTGVDDGDVNQSGFTYLFWAIA